MFTCSSDIGDTWGYRGRMILSPVDGGPHYATDTGTLTPTSPSRQLSYCICTLLLASFSCIVCIRTLLFITRILATYTSTSIHIATICTYNYIDMNTLIIASEALYGQSPSWYTNYVSKHTCFSFANQAFLKQPLILLDTHFFKSVVDEPTMVHIWNFHQNAHGFSALLALLATFEP